MLGTCLFGDCYLINDRMFSQSCMPPEDQDQALSPLPATLPPIPIPYKMQRSLLFYYYYYYI
jgi:hypothetical protein